MRGALRLTLLLTLIVTGSLGQDTKKQPHLLSYTGPDPSSPVPGETLRKLPVQIELLCKADGLPQSFTGTGFLVGIAVTPAAEEHGSFLYLVTNRHVAECWDETNHPREVVSTKVRINTQNGGAATLPLASIDDSGKPGWFFPDDNSVDLAVTPINPPRNLALDIWSIAFDSFAARDSFRQHRIGEGSTVMVTGTFVQFPGNRKFQPVLRQGILSMIPDEPMKTTTGRLGTVYLADVHVFGGNSGSPVFAKPQDEITHMGDIWLIGVVSGYYFEKADSKMEIAVTVKGETEANSGIAMIVPADEVRKLIESNPVLKRYRDAYLSTLQNKSPAPPHSP